MLPPFLAIKLSQPAAHVLNGLRRLVNNSAPDHHVDQSPRQTDFPAGAACRASARSQTTKIEVFPSPVGMSQVSGTRLSMKRSKSRHCHFMGGELVKLWNHFAKLVFMRVSSRDSAKEGLLDNLKLSGAGLDF